MVRSFGYAIEGLAYLVRTQRNFRIHLVAAAVAVAAGVSSRLSPVEWAILTVTIAFVMMSEGLNTGIEIAVSLASPERRPEAKAAPKPKKKKAPKAEQAEPEAAAEAEQTPAEPEAAAEAEEASAEDEPVAEATDTADDEDETPS